MFSSGRAIRNFRLRSYFTKSKLLHVSVRPNSTSTRSPFRSTESSEGGVPLTEPRASTSHKKFNRYAEAFDQRDQSLSHLKVPSPNQEYDANWIAMQKKRKLDVEREKARFYKRSNPQLPKPVIIREGTNEEVLAFEVAELLSKVSLETTLNEIDVTDAKPNDNDSSSLQVLTDPSVEYDVEIVSLSATGDGLAFTPARDSVFVVPFTVPGDKVTISGSRRNGSHYIADLVKIVEPAKLREGVTPKCEYFGQCGGCQLQMLSYEEQLKHKKTIVENAFKNFSGLSSDKVPPILDTMGSPLQYAYRTKLTPHFSLPRSVAKYNQPVTEAPPIGYNKKKTRFGPGEHKVMDIEHCPIGTPILQEGLKRERAKIHDDFKKFKNGATILLRESTQRTLAKGPAKPLSFDSPPTLQELIQTSEGKPEYQVSYPTHTDYKTYTSDSSSMTSEYIGAFKFNNRAGSFFQNNNSILRPFTSYVFKNCMPKATDPSNPSEQPKIKYLLDAYCGSGLFTITLSHFFSSALGIDIDGRGIEAARLNAAVNDIPNAGFIEADAKDLFADVPFPPEQSLVVIDPPRKGASLDFLQQLCRYGPRRVIYVSCNVHTQARDVGLIVSGEGLGLDGQGWRYEIESLKGFDFFPQTGHVEGVCVLNRVEKKE